MKKARSAIALICLFTMLCGCSGNNSISAPTGSVIENPFEETVDAGENQSVSTIASYGLGYAADGTIAFSGGTLTIPIELSGGKESTQVGILIYLDGILQSYVTEASDSKQTMHMFDTLANSKITYTVNADAVFDSSLEKHYINLVSVLLPNYRPADKTSTFGTYHSGLTVLPKEITFAEDNGVAYLNSILDYDNNTIIKNDDIKKYGIEEDGYAAFVPLNAADLSKNLCINEDRLSLSLLSYTMQADGGVYRVSFYKNHEIVRLSSGFDYIDIDVEKGKMSLTDIQIEDIDAGDFIYCVAVPLSNAGYSMPYKSKSTFVLPIGGHSDHTSDAIAPVASDNNPVGEAVLSGTALGNNQVFIADDTSLILAGYEKNGLFIYSSDDGIEIDRSARLADESAFIQKICQIDGGYSVIYYNGLGEMIGCLFDHELNPVQTIELSVMLGEDAMSFAENIDLNFETICYSLATGSELYVCGLNGENKQKLLSLSFGQDGVASMITGAVLMENGIAVTAVGTDKGEKISFYGVVGFDGNYEFHQKNNIQAPQVSGGTAIWADAHLELTQSSSGEIIVYSNGEFVALETTELNESQYAYLCNDGKTILTYTEDGGALKINAYRNGTVIKSLSESANGTIAGNLVLFSDKIYANTRGDSYKLVSWDFR